jgi:hypothetical protein
MVAMRTTAWAEYVDIDFWQCAQGKVDMNTADRKTSVVYKIALSSQRNATYKFLIRGITL